MDARTTQLLEAPIVRTLARLALPNMVVMFVQTLIGLIETFWIARLGTDALAGMALVFPVLMLFQMISAGAMGGGLLSATARALGAGRLDEANALPWYAVAIGLGLGALTTGLVLLLGRPLFAAMGGTGASLDAALTYAHVVFAGAILFWLFNSLAAVIRGTGDMGLPATVTSVGAVVLVPVSPLLIFGIGPFPALGIAGGGIAVLLYYLAGTLIFVRHLWTGRGTLRAPARLPRLRWGPLADVLRIGALASIIATTTNVTIVSVTGIAGRYGPAAVAGYGTAARLEYMLIPLVFGLGAPLAAMVGTAIGAGRRDRATRAAWSGALMAGAVTQVIGLLAAVVPNAWMGLYGSDPLMLDFGTRYMHIVAPFFGLFGVGFALYFAAQGSGRLVWALTAGLLRLVVAVGGGAVAFSLFGQIDAVYAAVGAALAVFCAVNVWAVASGVWLSHVAPASTGSSTPSVAPVLPRRGRIVAP